MKFTPPPWRVHEEENEHYVRVRGSLIGQKFHIADVRFGAYRNAYRSIEARNYAESEREEARANARLIAAAPELYAALADCLSTLDQDTRNMYGRVDSIVLARSVLSKAAE